MKLFDDHGRMQTHPCVVCGRPTIFRRCDACFHGEVTRVVRLLDTQPPTTPASSPLKPVHKPVCTPVRTLGVPSWRAGGALDGALDGDEFACTLDAWRCAPVVTPPTRFWLGMCLWCAREIRETRPEDETHRPPLSLIRMCPRHRRALIALTRWLRAERLYERFTVQDGFGRGKGGAA